MSDIRLVNVVPIVNGWNDAAKKNLEEAKTLMASGNHLDYNKGVVKESVANLVSGFADDLMSAPFIDPETLRPMAHWDGQFEIRQKEQTVIAEFVCDKIRPIIGKTWIVKEDIERATSGSCLSLKQIIEYAGWSHCSSFTERKELYAWHISDLKIYDQPKSLSGFSRHDFRGMNGTDVCGNESCEHYQPSGSYMLPPTCAINGCCLSKPPQSWCYVAEAEEDDAL